MTLENNTCVFQGLSNGLSNSSIDNKLELMSYSEEEDWTFCSNGDIIKVVDVEDLRDELEIISDIFTHYCLYPA